MADTAVIHPDATIAEIHDRAKAKEFSPGEAPVDIPYAD
jgi:hypothetical protein